MTANEKQVRMAAQMYEMRDAAKVLLQDKFNAHMVKIGALLQSYANAKGKSVLSAAIDAAKQPDCDATDVMMIMAAAVELSEAA